MEALMTPSVTTPGWVQLLLVVFTIHLLIFAERTWRRRQLGDGVTTVTFLLLVLSFGLRLGWPTWPVGDLALYTLLRYMAWVTAACSILLWIRRILQARATISKQGHHLASTIDEEIEGGQ